jgi:hypothetical protein
MKTIIQDKVLCSCGCGERFNKYDNRGRERSVIKEHRGRNQQSLKTIVKCDNCKKDIMKTPYMIHNVKHHFCNKHCEGEYSTRTGRRRGENNGHYNTITVGCAGCGVPVKKAESLIKRRNNRVYCPACIPINLRKGRKGFYVGYPKQFSASLRNKIRTRENFCCKVCGRSQELVGTLHVHHIDYTKSNNDPSNLVALCVKCHGGTNWAKEKWIAYFHSLSFS